MLTLVVVASGARLAWWEAALGLAVVGALAWQFARCPHEGPLALLPPTVDLQGRPLPARWHCDQCGRTWPAAFGRTRAYSLPSSSRCGQSSDEAGSSSQRC
jgi:hypothetical protein